MFSSIVFRQTGGCCFKESSLGDSLDKSAYFVNGCLHATETGLNR